MKKAIPFRMAAALSLYFSVLCALPVLDGHTEVMAFGLALGFLGLCAYVRFPHPAVRIIASLLPGIPLFSVRFPAALAAIGAAALWFFFVTVFDRLEIEHWQYVKVFRIMAFVDLILIFTNVFIGPFRAASLIFGAIALFSGVMTLRLLRMDGVDLRWIGMNLAELVLPLGAAACAGALLLLLLRHMGPIFKTLMIPIVFLISLFTRLMSGAMQKLGEGSGIENDFYDEYIPEAPPETPQAPIPSNELPTWAEQSFNWQPVVIAAVVLLALILLTILIVRSLRRGKRAKADEVSDYEVGTAFRWNPVRRKKERAKTNSQKIRQIYRDYLLLMRSKGVSLWKSTTSGEILSQPQASLTEDEKLRSIYLLARYAGDDALLDSDVTAAAEYLKTIKDARK